MPDSFEQHANLIYIFDLFNGREEMACLVSHLRFSPYICKMSLAATSLLSCINRKQTEHETSMETVVKTGSIMETKLCKTINLARLIT